MDKLAIARKIVKGIAIVVGLAGTVLCLMAAVGIGVASGWVRAPVAIIVAIVLPAVLADRLLPADTKAGSAKGLTSDVFALSWLAIPVLFAVVGNGVTRPWLTQEGDRLAAAGQPWMASGAYLLAGVEAQAKAPVDPSANASASAVGSAPSVASSPSAEASTTPSAAPSAGPPKPPPVGDGELSAAELFKKWAPSVVTISVKGARGDGGGTGFLIDDKGTIATNHHVIDGAKEGIVKFMNGAVYEEVWVLDEDPQADLAILRVVLDKPASGDAPKVTHVALADSDKIEVGERAISIGNPLGLEHTLTTGVVSSRRTYQGKQWIQMSTPVSPGNSGGPVFNGNGAVIGVTTAIVTGFGLAQNLNLAIPVNILKSKIKGAYPGKRQFGKPGGGSSTW